MSCGIRAVWIGLYAAWFAFDFAYNHDDVVVFGWSADLIRDFEAG